MKKIFVLLAVAALSATAHAKSSGKENFLAMGQGVSYPTQTSNVWISNGLTHENAVGAMYQNGMKLTGEYVDLDPDGSIIAVELGFGKGDLGAAIGVAKTECDGCNDDSQLGATVGFEFSSIGFGLGYHEDTLSLGLILNANETHRIGITADSNSDEATKYTSFGVGYTFVGSDFNFTVDASKRETDGASAAANEIIYLTPGVMFKASSFQVSLNYDTDLNDDNDTHDSDFWFGVGFAPGNNFNLGLYADYAGDWNAVLTFFF